MYMILMYVGLPISLRFGLYALFQAAMSERL